MSSLDRVELLSTLEHRYNIELNETQFADAKSTADLAAPHRATFRPPLRFRLYPLAANSSRSSDPHRRLLRADLARHVTSGARAHRGPRTSRQSQRPFHLCRQSRYPSRRYRTWSLSLSRRAFVIVSPRRWAARNSSHSATRLTNGLSPNVSCGGSNIFRLSRSSTFFRSAALFRLSRKFSFCWGIRRSRLQHSGFSGGRYQHARHSGNDPFPARHRPPGAKSQHSRGSHARRWPLAHAEGAPPPRSPRRSHRLHRRPSDFPARQRLPPKSPPISRIWSAHCSHHVRRSRGSVAIAGSFVLNLSYTRQDETLGNSQLFHCLVARSCHPNFTYSSCPFGVQRGSP